MNKVDVGSKNCSGEFSLCVIEMWIVVL